MCLVHIATLDCNHTPFFQESLFLCTTAAYENQNTMTFTDMLSLTDAEYAARIRTYSNQQLQEQLRVKGNQIRFVSGMSASSASTLLEIFTGVPFISEFVDGLGSRRMAVSKQKIRLLESEMQQRQKEIYEADMQLRQKESLEFELQLRQKEPLKKDHTLSQLTKVSLWTALILIPVLVWLYRY